MMIQRQFYRGFAVLTDVKTIDLRKDKITRLSDTVNSSLPLEAKWNFPNLVRVRPLPKNLSLTGEPVHYFFGGLPALMQAARKVEKVKGNEKVIYATDGELPKSLQSGHQAHVHPSEWVTDDCSPFSLIKRFLEGASLKKQLLPSDLTRYSYLHFPNSISQINKNPGMFWKFTLQLIKFTLTAQDGVSKKDHWLCDSVRESLDYHEMLSRRIEAETGMHTFKRGFRVYWSPDKAAMLQKKKIWDTLKIPCEFMNEREIMEHTLLTADSKLHVLKIIGDGMFHPETPKRIIDHLKRNYQNFEHRVAAINNIYLDPEDQKPVAISESSGKLTPLASVIGSPGHNDVYRMNVNRVWERLWEEVPVSGISSIWECTLTTEEFHARFGKFEQLVAQANLSNLHVTPWDWSWDRKSNTITLHVRATQGGNFNSNIANKSDLYNMSNNLNAFFIGNWKLISVGTCTRKTWVSNTPEFVRLSPDSGFIHGLSGIGYSFSGAPLERFLNP